MHSTSEAWFSRIIAANSLPHWTPMYWSVGCCYGSTGPMTGEISVLAPQCPCCILKAVFGVNQEKMHWVGAFIPF